MRSYNYMLILGYAIVIGHNYRKFKMRQMVQIK
jgi:hypothetical protein